MIATLIVVATLTVQQPIQPRAVQYRSHDVSNALKRGCKVQRVSPGAGKAEHMPIIRCPAGSKLDSADGSGESRPRG